MFPVGDINPVYRRPVVTTMLVAANLIVFGIQVLLGLPFVLALSFVPAELFALLQGAGGPGCWPICSRRCSSTAALAT